MLNSWTKNYDPCDDTLFVVLLLMTLQFITSSVLNMMFAAVRQFAAMRQWCDSAAMCGSTAVCGSAGGSVLQCAAVYATMCDGAAVCGSTSSSVRQYARDSVQQCGSV
jgi:hypothetical protein